ncbi:MAG TPA: TIGR01458 family HAD-type hydrolase [Nitrolancea sp.]|nr:TIGR01458 family HAD-type hydrolase [Nitrolancea sp.]
MSEIQGLLIDVDGVLRIDNDPLPGSVDALNELRRRKVPYRLLTNTTVRTRHSLGALMRRLGFDVEDQEIITAGAATAAYLRRRFPNQPCFLIATGDVADDFTGVPLTNGMDARVVVIGGAEQNFTYAALNHAFRLLLNGATLVAMHRGKYWITSQGPTLDAGAYIQGLEYVTGKRARVVGKPAAPFFRVGVRSLGLQPDQVAIVSDDLLQDIAPAMRLGITGILVRTGLFNETGLARVTPDHVIDTFASIGEMI